MHPSTMPVLRWIAFVGIGLLVAAVGETQYSGFIRGDWANLLGSVFFNALYLSGAAGFSFAVLQRIPHPSLCLAAHVAIFGSLGLVVEWFLIGNSPWGNPDAHQIGMFAYWACMVAVPMVYVVPAPQTVRLKQRILPAVLLYSALALAVQTLPWSTARIAYHLWSVILGYTALLVWVMVAYGRAVRRT